MNIFYLDHDTKTCSKYHNDKHCVKMILEYAQLLSTTHRVLDGDNVDDLVYKATHKNHPSTIWTRKTDSNYRWLYRLFVDLSQEYTYRYGREHLSYTKLSEILKTPPKNIPTGEFTGPTPAMPDYCKISGNSLASYRKYYVMEKSHMEKWSKREVPLWYKTLKGQKNS